MSCWLTPEQARPYAHLSTESLSLALADVTIPSSADITHKDVLVAAGVTFAGLPAGLIVGRFSAERANLELLSLVVAKPFRRLGFAKQLLDWLRAEAIRLGWASLSLSYPIEHACTRAMTRLTDSQLGWRRMPGLRLVHLDRAGGQLLVERLEALAARWERSSRFALIRWQSLLPEHHYQLDSMATAPGWARPLQRAIEAPIGLRDDAISQVLFDHGRPAGWLIAHRVGSALFRVSQWWVEPALQGRGVALILLKKAVADALDAQPLYRAGCFGVGPSSQAMLLLCERYLEPLAIGVQANDRVNLQINAAE
jgi:GNAT superfamily N-acetyltransferase